MNEKALVEPISAEKAWWLRSLLVLQAPRAVFAALRDESDEDQDARAEPLVLIGFLAGIGAVLGTNVAGRLLDDPGGGLLVVAAWAVFAGAMYGVVTVFAGGLVLRWAEKRLGGAGSWRLSRHLFGFALAPLALGLVVLWPVRIALYGDDVFRRGGADSDATGARLLDSLWISCGLWFLALLVVGLRTVHDWSWARSLAACALACVPPVLIVSLGLL
jgi:hypothetical protein